MLAAPPPHVLNQESLPLKKGPSVPSSSALLSLRFLRISVRAFLSTGPLEAHVGRNRASAWSSHPVQVCLDQLFFAAGRQENCAEGAFLSFLLMNMQRIFPRRCPDLGWWREA